MSQWVKRKLGKKGDRLLTKKITSGQIKSNKDLS